ncbi:hypothetical protein EB834_15930 [Brevibacterium aurantiacum]|nr:hypothetical protein CXR27_02105 [Brevibacterium aurantiacum]TGD37340.1 hypothetical protein EB834_15930 [Brevibacterium aurantiacum]
MTVSRVNGRAIAAMVNADSVGCFGRSVKPRPITRARMAMMTPDRMVRPNRSRLNASQMEANVNPILVLAQHRRKTVRADAGDVE